MRTPWHRADLGDTTQASTSIRGIQHIFPRVHEAAGKPADMGVFEMYDASRRTIVLYFSPPAAKLASIYDAKPCPPPVAVGGLKLVCGDERCWRFLRPLPDVIRSARWQGEGRRGRRSEARGARHSKASTVEPQPFTVPADVSFADLALNFDSAGAISCERAALALVCEANHLDTDLIFGNDEMAGWMIAQWYRLHRDRGGPADGVAEALLAG